jgi:hypothetical protein
LSFLDLMGAAIQNGKMKKQDDGHTFAGIGSRVSIGWSVRLDFFANGSNLGGEMKCMIRQ